ncbi:MAG: glycosyltransferase family 4 protein [Mediterranea sp.]|jgi:glycosyltransferase involved in cell wall biosynthesis|nr:glycosyltransferase family 4 protein [Mediterranea sp.]
MEINDKGELFAVVPLPQNQKLLFTDNAFWKDKYTEIILELLASYFENISSPVFQCHNLFLSNLAMGLKNRFGGKAVLHLHCLPWKYKLNEDKIQFNELYRLYEERDFEAFKEKEKSTLPYSQFDNIICLSEAAKDYLVNIHQVDGGKINIIHNGLEFVPLYPLQREDKEEAEILYVGKISKDKGTFELLDVLKKVNEKGYDFKLIIAGSCSKKLMNQIKNDYAGLNIDYKGQISYEELKALYATCSFGVIPSLHEQCSYVAIEMAMYGLPMIVSKVDALAEMFEQGGTVLFVPLVFDPDFGIEMDKAIFANHVIRLIEDKELRKHLGENVRKCYENCFTLDLMIRNTLNFYNQII